MSDMQKTLQEQKKSLEVHDLLSHKAINCKCAYGLAKCYDTIIAHIAGEEGHTMLTSHRK